MLVMYYILWEYPTYRVYRLYDNDAEALIFHFFSVRRRTEDSTRVLSKESQAQRFL